MLFCSLFPVLDDDSWSSVKNKSLTFPLHHELAYVADDTGFTTAAISKSSSSSIPAIVTDASHLRPGLPLTDPTTFTLRKCSGTSLTDGKAGRGQQSVG